jgi:hypothetical protein
MNHARTAIAVSALALSAAALGATQASAQYEPGPGSAPATAPPVPAPTPETEVVKASVDDTASEGLQAGASALGGAGVALGAGWFYGRRRVLNG